VAAITTTLALGTAVPGDRTGPDPHGQGGVEPGPGLGRRFLFGVGAGWNREELANHGDSVDELERRVATLRRRAADAGRVDDWVRLR
jgi:hypothetical protein